MAIKNGGPKRGADPQTTSDVEVLKTAPVIGTALVKAVETGTTTALARGTEIGERMKTVIEAGKPDLTGDNRRVGEAAKIVGKLEKVVGELDSTATGLQKAWRGVRRIWDKASGQYDRLQRVAEATQKVLAEMDAYVERVDDELEHDKELILKYKVAYDELVVLLGEYDDLIERIKQDILQFEAQVKQTGLSEQESERIQIAIREQKDLLDNYEGQQQQVSKMIMTYKNAIAKHLIQASSKKRLAQALTLMRPTTEVIISTELEIAAGNGVIEDGVKLTTGVDEALARLSAVGTKKVEEGTKKSIEARYGRTRYEEQLAKDSQKLRQLVGSVGKLLEAAKSQRARGVEEVKALVASNPYLLEDMDFERMLDAADSPAGRRIKLLVESTEERS